MYAGRMLKHSLPKCLRTKRIFLHLVPISGSTPDGPTNGYGSVGSKRKCRDRKVPS